VFAAFDPQRVRKHAGTLRSPGPVALVRLHQLLSLHTVQLEYSFSLLGVAHPRLLCCRELPLFQRFEITVRGHALGFAAIDDGFGFPRIVRLAFEERHGPANKAFAVCAKGFQRFFLPLIDALNLAAVYRDGRVLVFPEAVHLIAVQGIGEIAARFAVAESTVRKRLALARVSPRIFALYREGALDLETLQAFTVTDDHALQERVWDGLSEWERDNPRSIREALTESDVPSHDRRVRFVGLEAYEGAGGTVRRDLFEPEDSGFVQDVALLETLVRQKLEAIADAVRAEGWNGQRRGCPSVGTSGKLSCAANLLKFRFPKTCRRRRGNCRLNMRRCATAGADDGDSLGQEAVAMDLRRRSENHVVEAIAGEALLAIGQEAARPNCDVDVDRMDSVAEGNESVEPRLQRFSAFRFAAANFVDDSF
jgi:hypothetical protein